MVNTRKHRPNLSEVAYDEVKEMILSGELGQGERLVLERMSEKLNLSITPVREALNKLVQEDLVRVTPRSSYEVVTLGIEEIKDILDLRETLETFALKTAGENLATFPVQSFREAFRKLKPDRGIRRFIETDIKFHQAIIGTSKNKKLLKLFTYIHNAQRLLMIPSARISGRMEKAIQEHLGILDAIEDGALDLAVERLGSHIQQVKSAVVQEYLERGFLNSRRGRQGPT